MFYVLISQAKVSAKCPIQLGKKEVAAVKGVMECLKVISEIHVDMGD